MESSEMILATISNMVSYDLKADLIITDKRIVLVDRGRGSNTLGQFGALGGLIVASDEKARNNYEKSHTLDEVIKTNPLNRAFHYDDIKEVKIKNSKHWWQKSTIEIKAMAMGRKAKNEITEKYMLTDEQCKQLSDVLPKIDSLKGKLVI